MTVDIKNINPLTDDWDTSMLVKFDNEQLIKSLHYCIDVYYKKLNLKGLGKLTRLFFNSIINEIKERMV